MLLFAPTLADPALVEVALDSSFEGFLRYRNKKPGMIKTCIFYIQEAHAGHCSITTLAKKL